MKTTFNLVFKSSLPELVRSVRLTEEFIPFLQSANMFFYYPFTKQMSDDELNKQIMIDMASFNLKEAELRIKHEWEIRKEKILSAIQSRPDIEKAFFGNFECVLTFYGPYGYFYTPNVAFVNITKKEPIFWLETCLHEILHLVFEKLNNELGYQENEELIDSIFVELFSDIFSDYDIQKFNKKFNLQ